MTGLVDAHERSGFWTLTTTFVLLLFYLQVVRLIAAWALQAFFNPGEIAVGSFILSAAAFLIAGIPAWLVLSPGAVELALDWTGTTQGERLVYIGGGIFLLGLIVSALLFDADAFAANIYSALFIPAFEEILFRGFGWSHIRGGLSGKSAGWVTWVCITLLFGFWHLGYIDSILRAVGSHSNLPFLSVVLFFKVLVGIAVGTITGLARLRTGRVFAPFLLHALWNFMAR
ncbi:MAG: type II CAAX prenyl endopeptidase Rce1 family protein [Acidobacteriota bacterium]